MLFTGTVWATLHTGRYARPHYITRCHLSASLLPKSEQQTSRFPSCIHTPALTLHLDGILGVCCLVQPASYRALRAVLLPIRRFIPRRIAIYGVAQRHSLSLPHATCLANGRVLPLRCPTLATISWRCRCRTRAGSPPPYSSFVPSTSPLLPATSRSRHHRRGLANCWCLALPLPPGTCISSAYARGRTTAFADQTACRPPQAASI